jgi:hypothetical protein
MLRLAATLLGLTLITSVAQAQNKDDTLVFSNASECKPTGIIEKIVGTEYGEKPFSKSKIILQSSKNARLFEGNLVLYVNPESKTYTLVVQFDDKVSCILGAGSDFAPAFTQPKNQL